MVQAQGRRGGESRSPALTSQAGGRCKPENVQLSIHQAEAGLQGSTMAKCGVSVTCSHTLQLCVFD